MSYKGKQTRGELHIVPSGHDALLGRQWIRSLNIELQQLDAQNSKSLSVYQIQPDKCVEDIFSNFKATVEEKVGCIPGFQAALQLREGVKPIFAKERNIPYALLVRVDKELDSLVADGIISQVATTD